MHQNMIQWGEKRQCIKTGGQWGWYFIKEYIKSFNNLSPHQSIRQAKKAQIEKDGIILHTSPPMLSINCNTFIRLDITIGKNICVTNYSVNTKSVFIKSSLYIDGKAVKVHIIKTLNMTLSKAMALLPSSTHVWHLILILSPRSLTTFNSNLCFLHYNSMDQTLK